MDAFEAALAGRVPDNALLSHDLFEGVFARAGLVTDVELFESAPSHYGVAVSAPASLGPRRLAAPAVDPREPASRSSRAGRCWTTCGARVTAPAAFLTLVIAWMLPAPAPAAWSAFVVATIALPASFNVLRGLIPRRRGISKRSHIRAVGRDAILAGGQVALTLTMLAYQAWLMSDAIARTLVRVYVTHRRRLEWVTAAQEKAGQSLDLHGFWRRMRGGVVLAAAAMAVAAGGPDALPVALPFLALWLAAPSVARWISVPRSRETIEPVSATDAQALRLIARQTWRFFATFVGPGGGDVLPPDNFQETPRPVVAHRTSPTNIGLYLLSTIAARDFGWIGTLETVERLEATLGIMRDLERFRGHFYNWYDTTDCHPLAPRYVSSVDSGNLAGHLITLRHACEEMIERPRLARAVLAGIEDTILADPSRDGQQRLAPNGRARGASTRPSMCSPRPCVRRSAIRRTGMAGSRR